MSPVKAGQIWRTKGGDFKYLYTYFSFIDEEFNDGIGVWEDYKIISGLDRNDDIDWGRMESYTDFFEEDDES